MAEVCFEISAPLVLLANSDMLSVLNVRCWWKGQVVRERTGQPPSNVGLRKPKSLTFHGSQRARLRNRSPFYIYLQVRGFGKEHHLLFMEVFDLIFYLHQLVGYESTRPFGPLHMFPSMIGRVETCSMLGEWKPQISAQIFEISVKTLFVL